MHTRRQSLDEDRDARRHRVLSRMLWAGMAIIIATLIGWNLWNAHTLDQQHVEAESREHRLEQVEGDSKDLSGALDAQRRQFEECKNKKAKDHPECKKPVADSSSQVTSSAGPSGDRGAPGATGRDSIVPGPQGPAGRDGKDSTVPGPQGAKGDAGAAGQDGQSVKGDKGDAGDSVQGQPGADGKDGSPGRDGSDGKDGRGVKSITCGSDNDWQIEYTDGSTSTITGPCRVPTPTEQPSPQPTDPD